MAKNENERSDTSAAAAASELTTREFRACWNGDHLVFRKS